MITCCSIRSHGVIAVNYISQVLFFIALDLNRTNLRYGLKNGVIKTVKKRVDILTNSSISGINESKIDLGLNLWVWEREVKWQIELTFPVL